MYGVAFHIKFLQIGIRFNQGLNSRMSTHQSSLKEWSPFSAVHLVHICASFQKLMENIAMTTILSSGIVQYVQYCQNLTIGREAKQVCNIFIIFLARGLWLSKAVNGAPRNPISLCQLSLTARGLHFPADRDMPQATKGCDRLTHSDLVPSQEDPRARLGDLRPSSCSPLL